MQVVGCGTVGEAVLTLLESKGHTVGRYDPAKGFHERFGGPLFICIYDYRDLESCIEQHYDGSLTVIKTTSPPGTTDRLISRFPNTVYSPEFLDERTSVRDMMNPDKSVVGANDKLLALAFIALMGESIIMAPREAEILKLAINSFYALKVAHFNQVADLCELHGVNYSNVRLGLEKDRYIADQHLDPDKDGYRGFGGKCLPKDTQMFVDSCFFPTVAASAIKDNERRWFRAAT